MASDPVESNPAHYSVVFENDRVRVLAYRDGPGDRTTPHRHPDSVMFTLSDFDRRLSSAEQSMDVHLDSGSVRWLDAQEHWGENIGTTPTACLFVELKEPAPTRTAPAAFGPTA